jgi:small subunit ribosomal protein S2
MTVVSHAIFLSPAAPWLGGMLTSYQTVKASIDRLKKLEAMKLSTEWVTVPKKEQSKIERELDKLNKSLGGIQEMKKLPGVIFIIDTEKEHIAIKEAQKLGIPTIAVVDTNCSPEGINYVIPGNDDAIRSIRLFAKMIADSCLEGGNVLQERLRAQEIQDEANREESLIEEKKVSRFEGDIDLQGMDEADLAAQEEDPVTFEEALKAHEAAGTQPEKKE